MRVVQATRFGGPEVLTTSDVADPVAGPGQAVVEVFAADLLFLDTQIRLGRGGQFFAVTPPYVPGGGVAGRVSSIGEGIQSDWVGRRVVAYTGAPGARDGYAEQAVAAVAELIAVPDGLGLREAAALIHDGPTALLLFDAARIHPGQWVLVTAAGGGLGLLLVQLAHASGAHVIAAARGKWKLDLARDVGADAAVDYSEPGWPERVRTATGGSGPEVVFDGAGGQIGRAAFEITARGGWFSAHGAAGGGFAQIGADEAVRRGVTVYGIEQLRFGRADIRRRAERALSEASAGRIQPVIGHSFPLERAADAHAAIEARHVVGKTLLLI